MAKKKSEKTQKKTASAKKTKSVPTVTGETAKALKKAARPAAAAAVPAAPAPAPTRKAAPRKTPSASVPKAKPSAPAGGKRKILFVSSECAPFAKTGGLGDAVPGLAKALRRLGHDVRIIMPLYASIDRAQFDIQFDRPACVHMGQGEENWIGVHTGVLDRTVPVWFVEYARFFDRAGIYHDHGGDYSDNPWRFGLLCKAALQVSKDFDFIPDVMHLHDWPSAPTAVFLKTWDRVLSPLSETASVLTIHNIGHQGKYHPTVLPYYGVGSEYFTPDIFEDHTGINLLKAGVYFADAITTVSPTHAREIVGSPGGQGLEPYLDRRQADLSGILNGVDTEHWDPSTDPLIPAKYTPSNLAGKAICKAALQERFGLERDASVPLFGIVTRFAYQKGVDLIRDAVPRALGDMKFQLVVLGNGDPMIEDFFRWLAAIFPGRANAHIGYSNEISHWIEAGSDFFLMPSLWEPCGLNQIYSLKYGTLPVVRATGGLEDTVRSYNELEGTGTGFKFAEPTARALYDTIGWAVSTWYDRPQHIHQMRREAMAQTFSWDDSATQYLGVYEKAMANRRAV